MGTLFFVRRLRAVYTLGTSTLSIFSGGTIIWAKGERSTTPDQHVDRRGSDASLPGEHIGAWIMLLTLLMLALLIGFFALFAALVLFSEGVISRR